MCIARPGLMRSSILLFFLILPVACKSDVTSSDSLADSKLGRGKSLVREASAHLQLKKVVVQDDGSVYSYGPEDQAANNDLASLAGGTTHVKRLSLRNSYAMWRRFAKRDVSQTKRGDKPPLCFADLPPGSHWPSQIAPNDHGHHVLEYVKASITNLQRLQSIRGVLAAAKEMLDDLHIQHFLVFGTALGQERCQDVIPWDVDCDIAVATADLQKLKEGRIRTNPRYELQTKNIVTPFGLVDTHTGHFCDIWQIAPQQLHLDIVRDPTVQSDSLAGESSNDELPEDIAGIHALLMPNPYGPQLGLPPPESVSDCHQFPHFLGKTMQCLKFARSSIFPLETCKMNGIDFSCAQNQDFFLKKAYGENYMNPDHKTAEAL